MAKRSTAERFAEWLDAYRNGLLVLSVVVLLVGGYLASRMAVRADLTNLLPQSQPSVRDLQALQKRARPFGTVGQTVAGGIVGAAIGRQFGSGNDRDALTLIGAAAGAAVANQRAQRNQDVAYRDVTVQRCETVNERVTEQVIDGYNVTYAYQGRHYTMQTATPPGDRIRLAVDVRPVGYQVRY